MSISVLLVNTLPLPLKLKISFVQSYIYRTSIVQTFRFLHFHKRKHTFSVKSFNYITFHEDIHCLIKPHAMKT